MKRCGFGLVVFLVVFAVVGQCQAAGYSPDYTTINGRDFGYYVPESYDPLAPAPLLFMFHGMGGNSSEQSGGSAENGYYGWQTSAQQNGFIVLFPESKGYFKTWNLGAGGTSSDLDFVDDMIDWATANYNINTSQIFTTGHSWGAYFSYYVARYRSDDIAAFAAHSGGLGGVSFLGSTPPVPTGPSPTPTLNGIVLHAVDDGLVPYSNSQDLYDDLLANGHNVYDDGIGNDGIIEVDGWGPDNHRYRLQHNQTQWDYFLSVSPTPFKAIADGLWETPGGGTPNDPWDQNGVPTADNPVFVASGFTVTVDDSASALSVEIGGDSPSRLQVNDVLSVSGGVTTGASGTLSGTGTVAGNVVVQSGGILSPGNSGGVLSGGMGSAPIPEPGAVGLLGMGAFWLLVWRRR
ncbi:MAG: PEP-CTERM sorting domain-containing protein [Pirellulales bacterium]|nr:PEP-CTERM sorting domain-containing protein [Pirellulales bacterium]